jgi:hypothetical protein
MCQRQPPPDEPRLLEDAEEAGDVHPRAAACQLPVL